MRTVFDYNLTGDEVEKLGFLDLLLCIRHSLAFPDPLTEMGYRNTITPDAASFDLYLLFDYRNQKDRAAVYAARVPEKVAEFELGFDYQIRSINGHVDN